MRVPVVDMVAPVAGVIFRSWPGVGLCLSDARAGLGGTFGLEGCFLVLIGSFGLLEDVDDLLTLSSEEMPGSASQSYICTYICIGMNRGDREGRLWIWRGWQRDQRSIVLCEGDGSVLSQTMEGGGTNSRC